METISVPKIISSQDLVYQDKFQRLYRIVAEFDGFTKEYYVSDRGQRAALLAVRKKEVLLVRQYRLLINGLSLEIPGGRVDEDEVPEVAAIRECLEETGIQCFNLKPLITYHLGLDAIKNPTYIYISEEFKEKTKDKEGRRVWVPLDRCVEMVFAGQIVDSLSIIGLLSYQTLLGKQ